MDFSFAPTAPAAPVAQPAAVVQSAATVQPVQAAAVSPAAPPVAAKAKLKIGALLADKRVKISIASAALLLLAAGGFFMFGSKSTAKTSGKASAKKSSKSGTAATGSSQKSEKPTLRPRQSPGSTKREYVVGTGPGEYKTLREALETTKKHPNNHRLAKKIIKVPGGQTFAERIVIDSSFPRGIQIEVQGGQESILAPAGAEPIVEVRGDYDGFRLQGFRLDANGKETAIKLSGLLNTLKLKQLKIAGFTKSGIMAEGTSNFGIDADMQFEGVTFNAANPQAVGISFTKGKDHPAHARVRQCRFNAPMLAGILFDADASDIRIIECIFAQTNLGAKLNGSGRTWQDVVFANNSFFQNDRGVVLTNMPAPGSSGFGFYNNLFIGLKGPAVIVEQDFKEVDFGSMYNTVGSGILNNWTDNAAAPVPGELKIFEAAGGKRGTKDVQFLSVDPTNADFLAPTPTAPQRSAGSLHKDYGAQVGAVRSK